MLFTWMFILLVIYLGVMLKADIGFIGAIILLPLWLFIGGLVLRLFGVK